MTDKKPGLPPVFILCSILFELPDLPHLNPSLEFNLHFGALFRADFQTLLRDLKFLDLFFAFNNILLFNIIANRGQGA